MLQARSPCIPPVIVVLVYLLRQRGKKTVIDIKHHLLAKPVEEICNLCITAKPVLDYSTVMEMADILRRVNQVVHEDHVRSNIIAAINMTLLQRNEVEEQRLCPIMDQQPRNTQNPILEFDVPESISLPLLELDP